MLCLNTWISSSSFHLGSFLPSLLILHVAQTIPFLSSLKRKRFKTINLKVQMRRCQVAEDVRIFRGASG